MALAVSTPTAKNRTLGGRESVRVERARFAVATSADEFQTELTIDVFVDFNANQ